MARGLLKRLGALMDGGRRETSAAPNRGSVQFGNLGLGAEQRLDVLPAGRFPGPKSARSFGGDARSPVDCIKQPGSSGGGAGAKLFSEKNGKERLEENKSAKQRIGATGYNDARRRGSETVTRGHREPKSFVS